MEGNRARQCIAGFCLREPGSYHAPGSSHLKLRDHISPWRLKKHASLAISPSQPIRSISALASASCQSFIPGLGNDPPPACAHDRAGRRVLTRRKEHVGRASLCPCTCCQACSADCSCTSSSPLIRPVSCSSSASMPGLPFRKHSPRISDQLSQLSAADFGISNNVEHASTRAELG